MVVMCLVVTGGAEGVRLYDIVAILVGILVNERSMSKVLRQATFSMNGIIVLRLTDICKRYCTTTSTFGWKCVVCRGRSKMQLHRLFGSVCSISISIPDSNISAYPTQVNRRNSLPPTTDQFLIHVKTSNSSRTRLLILDRLVVEAQLLFLWKPNRFIICQLHCPYLAVCEKVQTTSPDIYTLGGLAFRQGSSSPTHLFRILDSEIRFHQ